MNVKNYKMEILTTLILIASAIFLFFNAYYLPLMRYQEDVVKLSKHYEKQKIQLEEELKNERDKDKTKNDTLNSVPKVLKAINNTCKDTDVIIRKLSPYKDNPFKFELNMITTYYKFLKILSEFEKLNIMLESISLNEYETTLDNPKKAIDLVLKVTGDVDNNSSEQSKLENKLKKIVENNSTKNPFQRNMIYDKNKIRRAINLTYIYKLSSITDRKNKPFATIDNKDYHIGDKFLDKGKITKIEENRVWITNEAKQKYFIGFKKQRGKE